MASPVWFYPGRQAHPNKENVLSLRSDSLLTTEMAALHMQLNMPFMAVQRNPVSPGIVPDQARDDDVGSLESF